MKKSIEVDNSRGWVRKRAYNKIHVVSWTIYLEKNGFVRCSFQNCNYMAFDVDEMKNHYSSCNGDSSHAMHVCKHCNGRTPHEDKLQEHILRSHEVETHEFKTQSNSDIKNVQEESKSEIGLNRIKDHDDAIVHMNASSGKIYSPKGADPKPEISRVLSMSWDISMQTYGYIKCPGCCLLAGTSEEMRFHYLICKKNPSTYTHECSQCKGRVATKLALENHIFDCHKDFLIKDENFMKNYHNDWRDQIEKNGYARCGSSCGFIHYDISIMIEHFKSCCTKKKTSRELESGIYCPKKSCIIWSTSKTALHFHEDHVHKNKKNKPKEKQQENNRQGIENLSSDQVIIMESANNSSFFRSAHDELAEKMSPSKSGDDYESRAEDGNTPIRMKPNISSCRSIESSNKLSPLDPNVDMLTLDESRKSQSSDTSLDTSFSMEFSQNDVERLPNKQYSRSKRKIYESQDSLEISLTAYSMELTDQSKDVCGHNQLKLKPEIEKEKYINNPISFESLNHIKKLLVNQDGIPCQITESTIETKSKTTNSSVCCQSNEKFLFIGSGLNEEDDRLPENTIISPKNDVTRESIINFDQYPDLERAIEIDDNCNSKSTNSKEKNINSLNNHENIIERKLENKESSNMVNNEKERLIEADASSEVGLREGSTGELKKDSPKLSETDSFDDLRETVNSLDGKKILDRNSERKNLSLTKNAVMKEIDIENTEKSSDKSEKELKNDESKNRNDYKFYLSREADVNCKNDGRTMETNELNIERNLNLTYSLEFRENIIKNPTILETYNSGHEEGNTTFNEICEGSDEQKKMKEISETQNIVSECSSMVKETDNAGAEFIPSEESTNSSTIQLNENTAKQNNNMNISDKKSESSSMEKANDLNTKVIRLKEVCNGSIDENCESSAKQNIISDHQNTESEHLSLVKDTEMNNDVGAKAIHLEELANPLANEMCQDPAEQNEKGDVSDKKNIENDCCLLEKLDVNTNEVHVNEAHLVESPMKCVEEKCVKIDTIIDSERKSGTENTTLKESANTEICVEEDNCFNSRVIMEVESEEETEILSKNLDEDSSHDRRNLGNVLPSVMKSDLKRVEKSNDINSKNMENELSCDGSSSHTNDLPVCKNHVGDKIPSPCKEIDLSSDYDSDNNSVIKNEPGEKGRKQISEISGGEFTIKNTDVEKRSIKDYVLSTTDTFSDPNLSSVSISCENNVDSSFPAKDDHQCDNSEMNFESGIPKKVSGSLEEALENVDMSLPTNDTINFNSKMKKKRGRPKKVSGSLEESLENVDMSLPTNATMNFNSKMKKKRGRPKKVNDSLEGALEHVNTFLSTNDTMNFNFNMKKKMGRPKKVNSSLEEALENVDKSLTTDDTLNCDSKIKKKMGRPKKVSNSLEEALENVDKSLTTDDTLNCDSKIKKKMGRPKKVSNSLEEALENVDKSLTTDDTLKCDSKIKKKIGRPKKVSNSLEEALENVDKSLTTEDTEYDMLSSNSNMKKKRGRPKKVSYSLKQISENLYLSAPTEDDMLSCDSQIKKKKGRPKKFSTSVEKTLKKEDTFSPMSDELLLNSDIKIKKKRGRPKKIISINNQSIEKQTIDCLNTPNLEIEMKEYKKSTKAKALDVETSPDIDIEKLKDSVESNSAQCSRKIYDQALEQVKEIGPDHDDGKVNEIASKTDQCDDLSTSNYIPGHNIKRKRGRPKKIHSVIDQSCSELKTEDHLIRTKPPKRTILKPKKFASYVISDELNEDCDLIEPTSNVQKISSKADQCENLSGLNNSGNSIKRKRGRPKKNEFAVLDVDISSNQSLQEETEHNRNRSTSQKRTISKPKKYESFVTENTSTDSMDESYDIIEDPKLNALETSTVDENFDNYSLSLNGVAPPIKRKRGRPKKISVETFDNSIDDDKFSLNLEKRQSLSSTPKRAISKPKKYACYVEETSINFNRTSSNISNVSTENKSDDSSLYHNDNSIPTENRRIPKKYKKRSRIISNISNSVKDTGTLIADETLERNESVLIPSSSDIVDSEEDLMMESVDNNANYSSEDGFKSPHKKARKRNVYVPRNARNASAQVTCAVCKESMTKVQYEVHASIHNYACWIEGETPITDLDSEDDFHRRFFAIRKFKGFKGFKCDKCGIYKKSSVGYVSHKSMCGFSSLERENLKVACPVCKRFMLPSSLKVHLGAEHRPTTHVPKEVKEDVVITNSTRRAAATRAEWKMEEVMKESWGADENVVQSKLGKFKRWFKVKRGKANRVSIRWKQDLEKNKELFCSVPDCTFKTDNFEAMRTHHSVCSNYEREFECRICAATEQQLFKIEEHIKINHPDLIGKEDSDYEDKEEEGEEEVELVAETQEINQNPPPPSTPPPTPPPAPLPPSQTIVNRKPNFVRNELYKTTLDSISRTIQRVHERTLMNLPQDQCLFEDLLAVPNGLVKDEDLSKYLPNTSVSMRFSLGTDNWEQLELLEARSFEDSACIFVGGPIWAIDWCPVPLQNTHQWLAVSCHPDMNAFHNMEEVISYDGVIQIWDFGDIDLCTTAVETPVLSIGIAHSNGVVWDMCWCPEGCHQPDSGRLGLLAVAFSSGLAVIYSVPIVGSDIKNPFYKLNPAVELTHPYEEPVQCSRITWSTDSPFNMLAVGYMDGSVSLYDITTSSLLLKDGNRIHPYKVFTAHSECVTGLQFIINKNASTLMTASLDKSLKFWSLIDTSAPISVSRKTPVRDAVFLDNWLCALSVSDDVFTYGSTSLYLHNFRDFMHQQTVPWMTLNCSQWSITVSKWSNSVVTASETGEIISIHPKQLFFIDGKTVKKTKMCMSTTILKKLTQEDDHDEKSKLPKLKGPFSFKEASENYGLVFTKTYSKEHAVEKGSLSKCYFPIKSVNKVSWNPNRQAFTFLAIGHQCGILRVVRDSHFDFAKQELNSFSNNML